MQPSVPFVRLFRSYEGTVLKKTLNGAHFHDDVIKWKHFRVSGPWGGGGGGGGGAVTNASDAEL